MEDEQITDYIYESKLYLEKIYSIIEHIDDLTYDDLNSISKFSSIKYLKLQLIKMLGDESLRKRRVEILMRDYEVVFNTDLISKLITRKRALSFLVEKLERLKFSFFENDDEIDGNSLVFTGNERELEYFKKEVNLLIPGKLFRKDGELSYVFESSFNWNLKLKAKKLKMIRDALNLSLIIEEIVLGGQEIKNDTNTGNQQV